MRLYRRPGRSRSERESRRNQKMHFCAEKRGQKSVPVVDDENVHNVQTRRRRKSGGTWGKKKMSDNSSAVPFPGRLSPPSPTQARMQFFFEKPFKKSFSSSSRDARRSIGRTSSASEEPFLGGSFWEMCSGEWESENKEESRHVFLFAVH